MSKFIFKPEYVDFGSEAGTKTVKFIHEGTLISLVSKPDWVESVSINYSAYVSGAPLNGTISMVVSYDIAARKYAGEVVITCDSDTYYIPVIYSYDSENISISSVIDNLFIGVGDTSYISERDRGRAMLAAKKWLVDNSYASACGIRFAELAVEDGKVYIPGDFVDHIAMYIYSSDGFLLPVYINNNINIGSGYLQDDAGAYVLDSNGYAIATYSTSKIDNIGTYTYYNKDIDRLADPSRIFYIKGGELSFNGMYRYDKDQKYFVVSGITSDFVVLEYVSDPVLRDKMKLDIGGLRVAKQYQEALEYYIYYKLIEQNRLVSMGEKSRALKLYSNAKKRCELRTVRLSELIQALRG